MSKLHRRFKNSANCNYQIKAGIKHYKWTLSEVRFLMAINALVPLRNTGNAFLVIKSN